ncbi:MAG: LytTR family transcriptional regulator DNA-binding domain-containing protein [Lachnospiraceae bacterium]|nr:LytTR family transcriptional regulator DNA-binding domain-containing protein [Lachnospiraceae bacterium]
MKSLENSTVRFLRINKSFLANVLYISEYHYDYVVMYDGSKISIGKKYKSIVRNHCIEKSSRAYEL